MKQPRLKQIGFRIGKQECTLDGFSAELVPLTLI